MTIPSELQSGTPRRVTLSPQGWVNILLSCLSVIVAMSMGLGKFIQPGHDPIRPAIAVAAVLFATVLGLARFRRNLRVLMHGRVTLARVTGDVTPWWYRLQQARLRRRRLKCEFPLLNGGTCKTTVETRDRNLAANQEVIVVYDRDEPEKAVLYPTPTLTVRAR